MNAKTAIALALFVVVALALFPTILSMTQCSGCQQVTESVADTSNADGTYWWNLTYPICPYVYNASAIPECRYLNVTLATGCGVCNGTYNMILNGTHYGGTVYWFTNTSICGLPATIELTGLGDEHGFTANVTYCALVISCMTWQLIQLIPVFYIIGVFSTVAIFAVAVSVKGKKT